MSDSRLASGQVTSTALTTLYQFPSGNNGRLYSFVLTNTTANAITVSVYINDFAADRLLKTVLIPSGFGKTVSVFEALGAYSGNDTIKVQAASTDAFNYLITGRLT